MRKIIGIVFLCLVSFATFEATMLIIKPKPVVAATCASCAWGSVSAGGLETDFEDMNGEFWGFGFDFSCACEGMGLTPCTDLGMTWYVYTLGGAWVGDQCFVDHFSAACGNPGNKAATWDVPMSIQVDLVSGHSYRIFCEIFTGECSAPDALYTTSGVYEWNGSSFE
jgi:hypothetical protein